MPQKTIITKTPSLRYFSEKYHQHLTFMHKSNNNQAQNIFHDIIKKAQSNTQGSFQAIFSI